MAHLLDNSWIDVLDEFRASVASMPKFSAALHPQADGENLLSASELMEARTDPMFGWQDAKSVTDLLALGQIAKPSLVTEEQLLDLADSLMSLEVRGLQGYNLLCSVGSCAYLFMLETVEKENPTLYAYLIATAKCMDNVLSLVHTVVIREDDEFMQYPAGFCFPIERSTADIVALLDKAVVKSDALKQRFAFRRNWLLALEGVIRPTAQLTVPVACEAAAAALNSLKQCSRSSELTEPDRKFFRTECNYWLPIQAPVKPMAWLSHEEAQKVFIVLLGQLVTIEQLLHQRAIYAAIDFLEDLALQQPLLPVRAAALLVATNDASSILFTANISNRVLETLSRQCGAPLYEKIAADDRQAVEDVVQYRIHASGRKTTLSPNELGSLRRHVVETVRTWAVQVGRYFIVLAETILCSRGRCHRRVANIIADLCNIQQSSWDADATTFSATSPGSCGPEFAGPNERELIIRSMVLSAFVTDLLLHAMTTFVQLSFELNLLTQAEILPATWYLVYLSGLRLENTVGLYITTPQYIPERKSLRKNGPPVNCPAITSRTPAVPPTPFVLRIELTRLLADSFLVFGAIAEADGVLSLKMPATSLTTAENIFNHRFISFVPVQRPTFFSYASCCKQISVFMQSKERAGAAVLSQAAQQAKQVSEHAKAQGAQDSNASQQRFFAAAEKSAKSLYVSMSLYEAISKKEDKAAAFAQFAVAVDFPFHPSIATISLKPKPKK